MTPTPSHVLVDAVSGTVADTLDLNARVSWPVSSTVVNRAAGTVTTVDVADGDLLERGARLYTTDLRPTVVATGTTPAFRAIGRGARGPDVEQLQQFLRDIGLYSGAVDGIAESRTVTAIEKWQKQQGAEATGVVEMSDITFVDSLPARASVDAETLDVGQLLAGGEDVLQVLADSPRIDVSATRSQAAFMPPGTGVRVTAPSGMSWDGVTGAQRADETGENILVEVLGAAGGPICSSECGQLPVTSGTLVPVAIVLVPERSGTVVPVAAVSTNAVGDTYVVTEDGSRVQVNVLASARGRAVIDGVDAGVAVQISTAGGTPEETAGEDG